MSIRMVVVDDSAFMRKVISDIFNEIDDVQVVGYARDGLSALDVIKRLSPDLVTLDIEMPGMDGLEVLREIKLRFDMPVIMLSSSSNPNITIQALELGALDFIEKPVDIKVNKKELKQDIESKIRALLKAGPATEYLCEPKSTTVTNVTNKKIKAVVIGSSTGGPRALVSIVSNLPHNMKVPIFIVQHMPKGFTASLAERMNKESKVKVVEAKEGMLISPGVVYLAPGDYHMTIENNKIRLNSGEKMHGVRPSVDYLFKSASVVYGDHLMGVILTGMGRDGTVGMERIKKNGGFNVAQNKETSVVFGMPGSAISKGVVDQVLSLEDISNQINLLVR